MGDGNQFDWNGATCDDSKTVTSLVLEDLSLRDYQSALNKLSALAALTTDGNKLTETIATASCNISGIQVVGSETKCPNKLGTSGCCAAVRLAQ